MRGPAMHVAQQFAEGNVVFQVQHITESLHFAEVVVKHQQYAGEREHDEQIERDAAHPPGVAVAHRVTIDLGGMQMQENVGEHAQGAIARRVVMFVTEDRGEDLRLCRFLEQLDLLFCFCRYVRLEGLEVLLDARLETLDQPNRFAIFSVRSFLFGHRLLSRPIAARSVSASSVRAERSRSALSYTGKNDPGSLKWLGCPLGH